MAWRNMRGGWIQNATQGFKTRALARAACGLRPIDPTRPHLRWRAARVEKVTTGFGHYWQVSHFVKVVPIEAQMGAISITLVRGLYTYEPMMAFYTTDRHGEYHHTYTNLAEFEADVRALQPYILGV